MERKGIDVSSHQGRIDWRRVQDDGTEFAMIRLGIGSRKNTPTLDRRFHENMEGALAAGIPVGVYLYSYALDTENAKLEADFVLREIGLYRGRITYPVAFDIEDDSQSRLNKATITAMCDAFCSKIAADGWKPMIYANLDWVKRKLDAALWGRYDMWLARWVAGENPSRHPDAAQAHIWQHTDKGRVQGVSGPVDMNICYKDYETDSPVQPPAPPPTPEERMLRPGDEGEDVAIVYHLLDSWGFVTGRKFNQPLEAAVKAFQGKYGLHVDGVIGPNTRRKMKELISQMPERAD